MSKKTYVIVSLALVFIAVSGAVGSYAYLNKKPAVSNFGLIDISSAGKVAVLGATTATQSSTSGLRVNSGAATTLEQQNLGSGGLALGNQQGGAISNDSSSSNSSSQQKIPGPETFAQYETYKQAQSSLFGDIQVGTGSEVKSGQKVAVMYKGWLTNGQLFDESKSGSDGKIQPFVFEVGKNQVITGWEQAILGMKVGGIRRMIVPPIVGYGEKGQGTIPGGAVLVFDVQLLATE